MHSMINYRRQVRKYGTHGKRLSTDLSDYLWITTIISLFDLVRESDSQSTVLRLDFTVVILKVHVPNIFLEPLIIN